MAFYGVIAGILFLEAFKTLVYALGKSDGLGFPAATLTVLVVTDVMITTDVFESELKGMDYHVTCKVMDVFCFLAIATMLVSINPLALQLFGKLEERPTWLGDPQVFWASAFAYWVSVLVWNEMVWNELFKRTGVWPVSLSDRPALKRSLMKYETWAKNVFEGSVFVYAAMAVLCGRYESFAQVPTWANLAVLGFALLYLYTRIFHKRYPAEPLQKLIAPAPVA